MDRSSKALSSPDSLPGVTLTQAVSLRAPSRELTPPVFWPSSETSAKHHLDGEPGHSPFLRNWYLLNQELRGKIPGRPGLLRGEELS